MDASELQTAAILALVGPAMLIAGQQNRIAPDRSDKWAVALFGAVAIVVAVTIVAGVPGLLFALSAGVLLFAREVAAAWFKPIRRIVAGIALGLAPQTLFLGLYNGGAADWAPWLAPLIVWWDNRALAINVALRNTDDIGFVWWSAIIVALLIGSWLFRGTRLVTHKSAVLSRALFVSKVSVLFAVSTAMPATNWDPSASHRLEAVRQQTAKDTASTELRDALNLQLKTLVAQQPDAIPALAAEILAHLSQDDRPDLDAGRKDRLRDAALEEWTQTHLIDAVAKAEPEPAVPAQREKTRPIPEAAALATLPDAKAAAKLAKERVKETKAATESIVAKAVGSVASAVKEGVRASIPLSDVPLAEEALNKILDRIADHATERIVKALPVEAGVRSVEALLSRLVASPRDPHAFERLDIGYRTARIADDRQVREKEVREEIREQRAREGAAIRR